ncbi:hypothetical protein F5B19DRAFT_479644, partial [Rostrohypoxylon terebratum]
MSINQTYVDHFDMYFGPLPWGTIPIGGLTSGHFIPLSVSEASPKNVPNPCILRDRRLKSNSPCFHCSRRLNQFELHTRRIEFPHACAACRSPAHHNV